MGRKRPRSAEAEAGSFEGLPDGMAMTHEAKLDIRWPCEDGTALHVSMSCVPVPHTHDSFGLIIDSLARPAAAWRKVVYSGDTKPCERLVEAGKGATVLIHEATLEDAMAEDAATKNHSTVGQALDVGRAMGAELVLLTHFSQRYAKVPDLEGTRLHEHDHDVGMEDAETKLPTTGIAFDLMSICLSDAAWLRLAIPPMQAALSEIVENDEEDDSSPPKAKKKDKKEKKVNGTRKKHGRKKG